LRKAQAEQPSGNSNSNSSNGSSFHSNGGGGYNNNNNNNNNNNRSFGGGAFSSRDERGSFGGGYNDRSYGDRRPAGDSRQANLGPSRPGARNERLERELFGDVRESINFEAYKDIPVEVSGADVPPPLSNVRFSSSFI